MVLDCDVATGTPMWKDYCDAQRNQNYCKWKVMQETMLSALKKLQNAREKLAEENKDKDNLDDSLKLPDCLYRGMTNVNYAKFKKKDIQMTGFFSTSVNEIASKGFIGRDGGCLLKFIKYKAGIYADISWLSEYSKEQEYLFAPCSFYAPKIENTEMKSPYGQDNALQIVDVLVSDVAFWLQKSQFACFDMLMNCMGVAFMNKTEKSISRGIIGKISNIYTSPVVTLDGLTKDNYRNYRILLSKHKIDDKNMKYDPEKKHDQPWRWVTKDTSLMKHVSLKSKSTPEIREYDPSITWCDKKLKDGWRDKLNFLFKIVKIEMDNREIIVCHPSVNCVRPDPGQKKELFDLEFSEGPQWLNLALLSMDNDETSEFICTTKLLNGVSEFSDSDINNKFRYLPSNVHGKCNHTYFGCVLKLSKILDHGRGGVDGGGGGGKEEDSGMFRWYTYLLNKQLLKDKIGENKNEEEEVKYVETEVTGANTYEVYRCNDYNTGIRFLETKKITKKNYYIIVETNKGNWGKDILGDIFKEPGGNSNSGAAGGGKDDSSKIKNGTKLDVVNKRMESYYYAKLYDLCGGEWSKLGDKGDVEAKCKEIGATIMTKHGMLGLRKIIGFDRILARHALPCWGSIIG